MSFYYPHPIGGQGGSILLVHYSLIVLKPANLIIIAVVRYNHNPIYCFVVAFVNYTRISNHFMRSAPVVAFEKKNLLAATLKLMDLWLQPEVLNGTTATSASPAGVIDCI